MPVYTGLEQPFQPDWEALVANIRRRGTPARVHHIELFQDAEIRDAIAERFNLLADMDPRDPYFEHRKLIAVQRFCGFDYVRAGLLGQELPLFQQQIDDTVVGDQRRSNGRRFQDEHRGPIMSWSDFERFPWPDPDAPGATADLEWFERHLPDDMCVIASGGFAHFAEHLSWLMGYETLCYALYDQRDLVRAIADKLTELFDTALRRILEFQRVKIVWGSDDLGFKTGLLISPDDTREFLLRGHQRMAELSHAAGRPYLLHACGKLSDIIDDLVHTVGIDGKHSFEDTIEDVREVKATYGRQIALLGGIDVDFLCRTDPASIRRRVRATLDICQPGGGYCLGTGNTAANYIPLDNYLAMLDEGRLYARE